MTSTGPQQADPSGTGSMANDSLSISLCVESTRLDLSTQNLTLRLLQPLSNPSMLAACREPFSSATGSMHMYNGRPSASRTGPEMLKLDTLDNAWRKVTNSLDPPDSITFDLSLPQPDSSSTEFQKIYWNTSVPSSLGQHAAFELATSRGQQQDSVEATLLAPPQRDEHHIAIIPRDVMRTVNTIATATRVRKQGKEVRFVIVYDEGDGISDRMLKLLKSQLGEA